MRFAGFAPLGEGNRSIGRCGRRGGLEIAQLIQFNHKLNLFHFDSWRELVQ